MASGKTSRSARKGSSSLVRGNSTPWGTIAAALVVVVLAATVFGYYFVQSRAKQQERGALAAFTPSDSQHDPSTKIPGVLTQSFPAGKHIRPTERVAYTHFPPFGGAHDGYWAACTGVVYPTAVRNENMVHSLEHGTVWIAYNPAQVTGAALDSLRQRVAGKPFTMMSPYPGLDQPISLQSWGHQLKLSEASDPRIDQFIQALRSNKYAYPEVGASCGALGPGQFDQDNPPPFNAAPAGPKAHKEDGSDIPDAGEQVNNPIPAR